MAGIGTSVSRTAKHRVRKLSSLRSFGLGATHLILIFSIVFSLLSVNFEQANAATISSVMDQPDKGSLLGIKEDFEYTTGLESLPKRSGRIHKTRQMLTPHMDQHLDLSFRPSNLQGVWGRDYKVYLEKGVT